MINTPTKHKYNETTNSTSHKQGGEFEISLAEKNHTIKFFEWMKLKYQALATDRPAFGEIDDLHEEEKQHQQIYNVVLKYFFSSDIDDDINRRRVNGKAL